MEEVIKKAERFRESHPGKPLAKKSGAELWNAAAATSPPVSLPVRDSQRGGFNRGFFGCGNRGRGQSQGQALAPDQCRQCKKHDHWKKDCPLRNSVGLCLPMGNCHVCGVASSLLKPCGHSPQTITPLFQRQIADNDALPTCEGKVDNQKVKVLLDSGCTTVGVRKSLLKNEQYTGEIRHCVAFGGEILSYPVATVYLDTPYFKGDVDACAVDSPICDVILGRVPGCTFTVAGQRLEATGAVQTRQQKKKGNAPTRPLWVVDSPSLNVSSAAQT
ncbi:hypothetical protein ACOMHN_011009 [Nucella lapillus]